MTKTYLSYILPTLLAKEELDEGYALNCVFDVSRPRRIGHVDCFVVGLVYCRIF